MNIQNIPQELKQHHQWLVWKLEERNGKTTKVPYNANTGQHAKSNDPSTWSSINEAMEALDNGQYNGIGLALSKQDGLTGIDIDLPPSDPIAQQLIQDFKGTYCELSPSGNVRIFALGAAQRSGKGTENKKLEVYDHNSPRYLTVTGEHIPETSNAITNQQTALDRMHTQYFKPKTTPPKQTAAPQNNLVNSSLEELLSKARKAKNGIEFSRLYDSGDFGTDQSSADIKLCGMLAFWLGKDFQLIDQAFRLSALFRDKWDVKHHADGTTYGQQTINTAIDNCSKTYTPSKKSKAKKNNLETQGGALEKNYNHTDLGNSYRFTDKYKKKARYCYAFKTWFIWTGTHWNRDESGITVKLAKNIVKGMYTQAGQTEDDGIRKALATHAKKSESKKALTDMVYLAQSELSTTQEQLDANNWLFNCKSGTIDLKTGNLHQHNPQHLLTKYLDAEIGDPTKCTLWIKFLNRIMNEDQEVIRYIQKAIGYTLTGDVSEQCLFFLYGFGKNGKSTFIELLESMLNQYSARTPSKTITNRKSGDIPNDIARLKGVRFVVSPEIEEGSRLNESMIKDLTGGDKISARFLNAEWFDFNPVFKLWMFGNHKPIIKGTDTGIWRRLHLIPFNAEITKEEQDPKLLEKLKAELPHILAWSIQGCLLWQNEGLGMPNLIKEAVKDYRDEMDITGEFLKENTRPNRFSSIKSSELYKKYKEWATDRGEMPFSQKRLGQQLTERGYIRERKRDGFYWLYLELGLNDFEDDYPESVNHSTTKVHTTNQSNTKAYHSFTKHREPCEPQNKVFSHTDTPRVLTSNEVHKVHKVHTLDNSLNNLETQRGDNPTFSISFHLKNNQAEQVYNYANKTKQTAITELIDKYDGQLRKIDDFNVDIEELRKAIQPSGLSVQKVMSSLGDDVIDWLSGDIKNDAIQHYAKSIAVH